MTIKGSGFAAPVQLQVNDVTVSPKKIKIKGGGSKLKIPGDPATLNVHGGTNRVRVIANGLRSAIKTFDF